jgi:hypothetical protein
VREPFGAVPALDRDAIECATRARIADEVRRDEMRVDVDHAANQMGSGVIY